MSRALNPAWIAARKALHVRYEALARVDDASRLAFVHGPARVFSAEQVREIWREALARPVTPRPTRNQVYVHVPFCKSICSFCNYERLKPSSPVLLQGWLERLIGSLEVLAPVLRSLTFDALYLGGGTPSVLPPAMLERLLTALERALAWDPEASRHVEFDPQVMSKDRLDVLLRHGFRRFSFGIETLDAAVAESHERGAQTREIIAKRFRELREAGIEEVACDLLAGLAGTSPEGLLADLEEILRERAPLRVDLYMLTPTNAYVRSHFGGDPAAFWAHYARFEAALPAGVAAIAARHGYEARGGHGHHVSLTRRDRPAASLGATLRPAYAPTIDQARAPVHLLGLGPSARSQIFGHASFVARDPAHERGSREPTYFEGHRIDGLAAECRVFLAHYMRDHDVLDRAMFREVTGADVADVFPEAIAAWQALGIASLDETALRFVPQERRERTRALLWLVPEPPLEHEIAMRQGLDVSEAGVRMLAGELADGRALAGGWRTAGVLEGRIVLEGRGGHRVRLRVAPRLEGRGLRLVCEDPVPADEAARQDLRRSVAVLQRALAARHVPGIGAPRRRLPVTD